jgi:hypothetical protein
LQFIAAQYSAPQLRIKYRSKTGTSPNLFHTLVPSIQR